MSLANSGTPNSSPYGGSKLGNGHHVPSGGPAFANHLHHLHHNNHHLHHHLNNNNNNSSSHNNNNNNNNNHSHHRSKTTDDDNDSLDGSASVRALLIGPPVVQSDYGKHVFFSFFFKIKTALAAGFGSGAADVAALAVDGRRRSVGTGVVVRRPGVVGLWRRRAVGAVGGRRRRRRRRRWWRRRRRRRPPAADAVAVVGLAAAARRPRRRRRRRPRRPRRRRFGRRRFGRRRRRRRRRQQRRLARPQLVATVVDLRGTVQTGRNLLFFY